MLQMTSKHTVKCEGPRADKHLCGLSTYQAHVNVAHLRREFFWIICTFVLGRRSSLIFCSRYSRALLQAWAKKDIATCAQIDRPNPAPSTRNVVAFNGVVVSSSRKGWGGHVMIFFPHCAARTNISTGYHQLRAVEISKTVELSGGH